MKVFSYATDKGLTQIGVEYKGDVYNFSLAWELYKQIKNKGRGPELNFLQVMVEADFFHPETFEEVFAELQQYRTLQDLKLQESVRFQPPIGRPQKILCVGRNFEEHAGELGNEVPEEPIFFSKSPSALIAHQDDIRIPPQVGRVDHEGELAVVIGKTVYRTSVAQAEEAITGYTILNDVTARDLQTADKKRAWPWFRSKSFDTFCPCGPYLIPKKSIKDHKQLTLEVKVNGERRQFADLASMIFDIPEIISHISNYCTLQPGDIIATGTPSGVGPLHPGDQVECTIEQLGTLENKVA